MNGACPAARKLPLRMPEDWTPPVDAWSAEFGPETQDVVLGCYAVQRERAHAAEEFVRWMKQGLSGADAPIAADRAAYIDVAGAVNDMFFLYWTDKSSFERWRAAPRFADWWGAAERQTGRMGYWREEVVVPRARLETLYSTKDGQGLVRAAPSYGEPVQEHAYWGSARDRIPASASDPFEGPGASLSRGANLSSKGRRLRVSAPANLSLIRSGQNWSATEGVEREHYLASVHPVLREGMDYLAANPLESGCATCRFVDLLTMDGERQEQTFTMAYFLTLGHMEKWSETHATHLAIFGEFFKMVERVQGNVTLKLSHEVFVLPENSGLFEYVNCHPQTGLLPYFPVEEVSKKKGLFGF